MGDINIAREISDVALSARSLASKMEEEIRVLLCAISGARAKSENVRYAASDGRYEHIEYVARGLEDSLEEVESELSSALLMVDEVRRDANELDAEVRDVFSQVQEEGRNG